MLITIKGEISGNTIIVGDLNTPFSAMSDHPNRKSVRKHGSYMKH